LTEAGEDLDFTNFRPNDPSASPSPVTGATTPAFLPTSAMSIPLPDWIGGDAHAATGAGTSSAPPRDAARGEQLAKPLDSILCIEVESGANDVPPAIEETAILFANGQAQEALTRVGEAITNEDLGPWHLQAWLMLFDLLQHLNMRAEFEERTLQFVVRFERSPPVWSDALPPAPTPTMLRTGGSGHVALTGGLTSASAPAIEHLRRMLEKQPRLRLDLGRLDGIDGAGARLLLDTLAGARKAKKELYFTGEAELLRLVEAQASAGDRKVEPALWLLALEIVQQLGDETRYEDLALEYTVTYEVSPPAWEQVTARGPVAVDPVVAGGPDGAETFVVEGDIAGGSDLFLAELEAFAAAANPVVIDLQRTRRVDFVSAGQLLNLLARLTQAGKSIEIRGANQLVVALFAMMGLREFARLVARK
jgi:anti-anti-sigma regulatory factor